jgi:HSP20 family protein
MTLVRHAPWALMNRLQRDLDGQWRALTAPDDRGAPLQPAALVPSVDVHEDAESYVVHADLPGVLPADIEVTADRGTLTIRAQRRAAEREGNSGNGRVERFAGTFIRRFTLPDDANAAAISARSLHGVLELTIRKHVRPEPRRIHVEAA